MSDTDCRSSSKEYFTVVIQYDISGDPCDPPPFIEDRLVKVMQVMHEMGFGMDVVYGHAKRNVMFAVKTEY